jgi:hypothetical protein
MGCMPSGRWVNWRKKKILKGKKDWKIKVMEIGGNENYSLHPNKEVADSELLHFEIFGRSDFATEHFLSSQPTHFRVEARRASKAFTFSSNS